MLFSPGTKNICPPPIPEDVQAVLKLLGVEYVWDRTHKCYTIWCKGDEILKPRAIWHHPGWHEDWTETLNEIADDIARKVTKPPTVGDLTALHNELLIEHNKSGTGLVFKKGGPQWV